jgi:hypothetical protein
MEYFGLEMPVSPQRGSRIAPIRRTARAIRRIPSDVDPRRNAQCIFQPNAKLADYTVGFRMTQQNCTARRLPDFREIIGLGFGTSEAETFWMNFLRGLIRC